MIILKKYLILILSLFILLGCSSKQEETALPQYEEIKINAVWFSYIDYRDQMQHLSETEFVEKVKKIISDVKAIGINTIFVHAIAFSDAFYNSSIYQKTFVLPSIDYDPLKIFVEEAHNENIRIEAWINPMRSFHKDEITLLDSNNIIKKWIDEKKPFIRLVEDRYYLNPAYNEVNDLILSVVEEIMNNYEVDGIHMDDYFYPEKATAEFDNEVLCEGCDLAEFRKNNVNNLVASINKAVKKRGLVYGISPAGNIDYSINVIYGDVKMWVDAGVVDYLIPQIYWGYDHPTKPFLKTLQEWEEVVAESEVDLIIGLAGYKIGWEDQYAKDGKLEWINNNDILARQYNDSIKNKGMAIFSYQSLFYPPNEIKEHVETEITNLKNVIKP